jgi:hypothetical protein
MYWEINKGVKLNPNNPSPRRVYWWNLHRTNDEYSMPAGLVAS